MRIGIDARVLQHDLRGQGQYVYYLVKYLAEIDKSNEYVLFYNGVARGSFAFSKPASHLKQIWCRIPGRFLKQSWSLLRAPCIEDLIGKVDVFHNTINFNHTHYTPLPSRAPMVATFHGMAEPSLLWEQYNACAIEKWLSVLAKDARMIITVSGLAKADLLKRIAFPSEKIKVIYPGVDEIFRPLSDRPEAKKILSKYGLQDKHFILYIGAAEKNKNLSALIDAFRKLQSKREYVDLYLVLAGSIDTNYEALRKEAVEKRIMHRLILTGQVTHDELPSMYSAANVFVLPTVHEWFGMPVLEALSCATPVAASANTGALEVVGDAVITFDPFNVNEIALSLEKALSDKALCAALREKGLQKVAGCTWHEAAKDTLEVYKEVCV